MPQLIIVFFLTLTSSSVLAQSRPNQCAFDISGSTISAKCYVEHEGKKVQGSGQANFSGAGLSGAKSQACLKCRSSLASQISPEGGQVSLSSDQPARVENEQQEEGPTESAPEIINEAEELGLQKFSDCLTNSYIKREYPDSEERAKECFDFASKQAKAEVTEYREENCQRDSERSEIVTCNDGSRYKLVDINNLGGEVIDISRHSARQQKGPNLGQQTQFGQQASGMAR